MFLSNFVWVSLNHWTRNSPPSPGLVDGTDSRKLPVFRFYIPQVLRSRNENSLSYTDFCVQFHDSRLKMVFLMSKRVRKICNFLEFKKKKYTDSIILAYTVALSFLQQWEGSLSAQLQLKNLKIIPVWFLWNLCHAVSCVLLLCKVLWKLHSHLYSRWWNINNTMRCNVKNC